MLGLRGSIASVWTPFFASYDRMFPSQDAMPIGGLAT
jgi:hypothetical protein